MTRRLKDLNILKNFKSYGSIKSARRRHPFVIALSEYNNLSDSDKGDFHGLIVPDDSIEASKKLNIGYINEIPCGVICNPDDVEEEVIYSDFEGSIKKMKIVGGDEDDEYYMEDVEQIVGATQPKAIQELYAKVKGDNQEEKDRALLLLSGKTLSSTRLKTIEAWWRLPDVERAKLPLSEISGEFSPKADELLSSFKSGKIPESVIPQKLTTEPPKNNKPEESGRKGDSSKMNKETYDQIYNKLVDTGVDPRILNLDAAADVVEIVGVSHDDAVAFLTEVLKGSGVVPKENDQNDDEESADDETITSKALTKKHNKLVKTITNVASSHVASAIESKLNEIFFQNAILHCFIAAEEGKLTVNASFKKEKNGSEPIVIDKELVALLKANLEADKTASKTTVVKDNMKYGPRHMYKHTASLGFSVSNGSGLLAAVTTLPLALVNASLTNEEGIAEIDENTPLDLTTQVLAKSALATVIGARGSKIKEDPQFVQKYYTTPKTQGSNVPKEVVGESVYQVVANTTEANLADKDADQIQKINKRLIVGAFKITNSLRGSSLFTPTNVVPIKKFQNIAIDQIKDAAEITLYNTQLFGNICGIKSRATTNDDTTKVKKAPNPSALSCFDKETAEMFTLSKDKKSVESSAFIGNGAKSTIMALKRGAFDENGKVKEVKITQIPARVKEGNKVIYKTISLKVKPEDAGFDLDSVIMTTVSKPTGVKFTELFPTITPTDIMEAVETQRSFEKASRTTSSTSITGTSIKAILDSSLVSSFTGAMSYRDALAALKSKK